MSDWTRESEGVMTMKVGGEVYVATHDDDGMWIVERRDPRGIAYIGNLSDIRGSGVALELAKALVLAHARILAEEREELDKADRATERWLARIEDRPDVDNCGYIPQDDEVEE